VQAEKTKNGGTGRLYVKDAKRLFKRLLESGSAGKAESWSKHVEDRQG